MKTLILLSVIFSSVSFASEIERVDACTSYRSQIAKVQSELSRITYEQVRQGGGPEESSYSSSSSEEAGSFNCERESSNYDALRSQREYYEKELARIRILEKNYCPASRPEA